MSAAEKLKRLNVELLEDSRTFCNVLPEVIAVLKAAELEAALAIINDERETSLGHTLSALDEKLP